MTIFINQFTAVCWGKKIAAPSSPVRMRNSTAFLSRSCIQILVITAPMFRIPKCKNIVIFARNLYSSIVFYNLCTIFVFFFWKTILRRLNFAYNFRCCSAGRSMDKYKFRKNAKVENGANNSEVTTEGAQVPQKTSKKKHSKKGSGDGERNSQFSFRYLLYNSPFYPQRLRHRNRRSVGQ